MERSVSPSQHADERDVDLSHRLIDTHLTVVANRLPVRAEVREDGIHWIPSPGGLVSALTPALKGAGRPSWVGWADTTGHVPSSAEEDGFRIVPMSLTPLEVEKYYEGFSNATIWPLYHDSIEAPTYHRSWWDLYVSVNQRFADKVAEVAEPSSIVWVHDYQLQLVPEMLRERRPDLKIGFFLHIPFPEPELFMRIPWRAQIVRGILGADVIGFQTEVAKGNFIAAIERTTGLVFGNDVVLVDTRPVRIGAFPVGIDFDRIIDAATSEQTAARVESLRELFGHPAHVILGVDRLDYTKGIELRLRALRELLSEGRIDPHDTVIIQIAEPSRGGTRGYDRIKTEVEQISGGINGDHADLGRPLLEYHHRSVELEELVALYRFADVMLVTPFADGMNLVAKEYVAARTDTRGVLVLSEFAGSAQELTAALLVNPYDINAVKDTMVRALEMTTDEQELRMQTLNAAVQSSTVAAWADSFLKLLIP